MEAGKVIFDESKDKIKFTHPNPENPREFKTEEVNTKNFLAFTELIQPGKTVALKDEDIRYYFGKEPKAKKEAKKQGQGESASKKVTGSKKAQGKT